MEVRNPAKGGEHFKFMNVRIKAVSSDSCSFLSKSFSNLLTERRLMPLLNSLNIGLCLRWRKTIINLFRDIPVTFSESRLLTRGEHVGVQHSVCA